jgi:hypothetical protein
MEYRARRAGPEFEGTIGGALGWQIFLNGDISCQEQVCRRQSGLTGIQHGAELIVGQHTERDLTGEQLRSRRKDGEDDRTAGQYFSQDRSSHDQSCVSHIVHLGMIQFEIDQDQ